MEDNRTLKELAQEAIAVQDACNLSGVILSWSNNISRLRKLMQGSPTNEINFHPINVLFASKVASLTGAENGLLFVDAYNEVMKIKEENKYG